MATNFKNRNSREKKITIISKISIFSLIGVGLNVVLIYTYLRLWICPQVSDAEMISNFTVLICFEFIMVHSGVFMSLFGRSWKAWLVFIVFYGLFALVFNAMVSGNQILILYSAVVLNRMLPNFLRKPAKNEIQLSNVVEKNGKQTENAELPKELQMSAVYAMIYCFLCFIILPDFLHIPKFGLNDAFLGASNYNELTKIGGDFADKPHIIMCFGVFYYLFLTLIDVIMMIKRSNKIEDKLIN